MKFLRLAMVAFALVMAVSIVGCSKPADTAAPAGGDAPATSGGAPTDKPAQ